MGESTSQIERDIAAERNELGRNLQVLEHKARSLADWRMHFRRHPFALMAVAIGGGALLGVLTNRMGGLESSPAEYEEDEYLEPESPQYSRPSAFATSAAQARRQFGDTWDRIAETLLAVASAKAIQFVADKVPGFREEFSARHPEQRGGYTSGRGV